MPNVSPAAVALGSSVAERVSRAQGHVDAAAKGNAKAVPDIAFSVDEDRTTLVTASLPGVGEVGWMHLERPNPNWKNERQIRDLDVRPEFQRRGIATAMWNAAVAAGLDPAHSTWRTRQGDAFAKAVGGDIPTNLYGDDFDDDDDLDDYQD